MLASIQRTIDRWRLRQGVQRAVVAVSGGSDSVALLLALHRLWQSDGIALTVVHVNHGIRGEDARQDAVFVAELAARLGMPFLLRSADVPAAVAHSGESCEMAARRLRYDALHDVATQVQAEVVCTGHTADDQLETLFLRLARGTSGRGLGGMAVRTSSREGLHVLRPLLECRRSALREWLRAEGQTWREDASNAEDDALRNRVRRSVTPAYETALGPTAVSATLRTLELLRDEDRDWLAPLVQSELRRVAADASGGALDACALRRLPRPLARRVLLAWLQHHRLPSERQTLSLLERLTDFATAPSSGTRALPLGAGRSARRIYETLTFNAAAGRTDAAPHPVRFDVPGTIVAEQWGIEVRAERAYGASCAPRRSPLELPQSASLAWNSIAGRTLVLRSIRPGDRILPVGATGHRKLSDILVNVKVPRDLRSRVPLIECNGVVAWLPGYAVSAAFAVPTSEAPSLRLTLSGLPSVEHCPP